ncbi:MAG: hypothetical protein WBG42_00860 [Cryomorphaceae bacterium]
MLISELCITPPDDEVDTESILAFAEDGPWRVEYLEKDETFKILERTNVAVIDTTIDVAYASFWLNA